MNIQAITKILTDAGIEETEAKREVSMLLEHFCGYTEIDKIRGKELSSEQISLIAEKAELRASDRIPIQYIIGESWFMGEYFKVTPPSLDATMISLENF